jgi:hypothetical protein
MGKPQRRFGKAPEGVADVLADADAGAPWRAELGIVESSAQLVEAIRLVGQAVRASTPSGGSPTFGASLLAAQDNSGEEQGLGHLARQVLRATLEQRQQRRLHTSE